VAFIKEEQYEELAKIILSEEKQRQGVLVASRKFGVSTATIRGVWYSLKMKPYRTKVEKEIKQLILDNQEFEEVKPPQQQELNFAISEEIATEVATAQEEIKPEEEYEYIAEGKMTIKQIENTGKLINGFISEAIMTARNLELENKQLRIINKQLQEDNAELLEIKKEFDTMLKHLSRYQSKQVKEEVAN
jgi:hypothetical protein